MDYTLANVPGMEFGSVFITDTKENLAASAVAAGWAKVSPLDSSPGCRVIQRVSAGTRTTRWHAKDC